MIKKLIFLIPTLILLLIIVVALWPRSEMQYHRAIITSGGFDPSQEFKHLWTNREDVGFDFFVTSCFELRDIETLKIWGDSVNLSEKHFHLIRGAQSHISSQGCIGKEYSLLVLEGKMFGPYPVHWEILLLDKSSKNLLLIAGDT